MSYVFTTTPEGLPLLVVNENIYFAWDPNEPYYDLFLTRIETQGWDVFAQLLANDPNTAFTIFCNG